MDKTIPKKEKWERILSLRAVRLFIGRHDIVPFLRDVFVLFANSFKIVICDIEIDAESNIGSIVAALNQEFRELIDDEKLPATTVKLNGDLLNLIDYMLDAVVMSLCTE